MFHAPAVILATMSFGLLVHSWTEESYTLNSLFNPVETSFGKLGITPSGKPDEHPCFRGFDSAVAADGVCKGFSRAYANDGSPVLFNAGSGRPNYKNFSFAQEVGVFNLYVETAMESPPDAMDKLVEMVTIADNLNGEDRFTPKKPYFGNSSSASWLEELCLTVGPMPFWRSCGNRITVLLAECGFVNAFVSTNPSFFFPANNESPAAHDLIFVMCVELLMSTDKTIEAHALTVIHELTHVIQWTPSIPYSIYEGVPPSLNPPC